MQTLPDLLPGRFLALLAPHAASEAMLALAARLARRGPLQVIDGGNRFNAYHVARLLRGLSGDGLAAALGRIYVARAFTCYQIAALLEQTIPGAVPLLVIDLLDTFYDQSVPLFERRRLLGGCVERLRLLSQGTVVVASLRPPRPPQTDPTGLLQTVQAAADQVWFQEEEPPSLSPRLF
jgi:hypothetical protein